MEYAADLASTTNTTGISSTCAISAEEPLSIGQFYDVKITDSEEFDLYGTTIY